jgi:hypothetical protein
MERRLAQPGFNLEKQEDWRSQDSILRSKKTGTVRIQSSFHVIQLLKINHCSDNPSRD